MFSQSGLSDDRWLWRFMMSNSSLILCESPSGIDAPATWVRAIEAVSQDLCHLRYGRKVDPHSLVWHLAMDDRYEITIGWEKSGGLHEFSSFNGVTMDAPVQTVTAWIAETVQDHLAGFESIQWPSKGQRMLAVRVHNRQAVWVETRTETIVSPIGNLNEDQYKSLEF